MSYKNWPTADFQIVLNQHQDSSGYYRLGIDSAHTVVWVPENKVNEYNCIWRAQESKQETWPGITNTSTYSALLYNSKANRYLTTDGENHGGLVWVYYLKTDTKHANDTRQRFSIDDLTEKCKIYLTSNSNMTINVDQGRTASPPILFGSRVEGAEFIFR